MDNFTQGFMDHLTKQAGPSMSGPSMSGSPVSGTLNSLKLPLMLRELAKLQKKAAYIPEPGPASPISRVLNAYSPPKPKVPVLPKEKPTTPYKNTYSEEKI